jgi:hypothetical protein
MNKIYLKHDGNIFEPATLERNNGALGSPDHGTLYELLPAYTSDSDRTVYKARAVDADGNEYLVKWDTTLAIGTARRL